MHKKPAILPSKNPFLVAPYILVAVYLSCVGWLLSILGQLNTIGYSVALAVGLILAWIIKPDFGRLRIRRFRRLFPAAFLFLAVLAAIGGIIHAPNNYDGLAYRIPRVLHWLAEGRWHWIHTEFPRLNTRATGWEWLAAPILSLCKSYRWLFLINTIAFCAMPGLVFSLFTRLGVRRKVAWHWMWLLPTGYCFLLQAGSIGNDMLGAVFALAAVGFALRAKATNRVSQAWFSILAAAVMTGCKSVNLPLLLPWFIAFLPCLPLLTKKSLATAAIIVIAAGASLLPISVLNYKHCGDWSGQKLEFTSKGSPFLKIPANAILLLTQNASPPVFPKVNVWNDWIYEKIPNGLKEELKKAFEPGGARFALCEMQLEENAALGLGLTLLIALSAGVSKCHRELRKLPSRAKLALFILLLTPWIALLVVMATSGISSIGRVMAAYYPLMLPLVLQSWNQIKLVCKRWWRCWAVLSLIVALIPLVLSPARPLFPATTILDGLRASDSNEPLLRRMHVVYNVYANRSDAFAPAVVALPAGIKVLGFVSFDDPEASLWKPFGKRRIFHVTRSDNAEDLRRRGIEYVLVDPQRVPTLYGQQFDDWMKKMDLEKVKSIPLTLRAGVGELDWYLLKVTPRKSNHGSNSPF